MGKEIDLTFERKSVGGEPQYSDNYLEWISSQKWKSYDTYGSRGRQVRVKIHPTHMGQEDTMECPLPEDNLIFANDLDNMASLTGWQTLDPSRVERTVTVMVPTEWYVNGEAYYAMTALPAVDTENLGILTRKERKMIDSGLVVEHPRGDVRHCHLVVAYSSWFRCDMDVSVSFSNNQTSRSKDSRRQRKSQCPNGKRLTLDCCLQISKSHTHHSWKLGRKQVVLDSVTSLKHKFSG